MSSDNQQRVTKTTRRTPTCDTCKARHQKCSGLQPQCNNCELRGITCSFSKRPNITSRSHTHQEPMLSPSTLPSSRPLISSSEYAHLYSQIFGDVVRGLNLDRRQYAEVQADSLIDSRLGNVSLPSFYREAATLVEQQVLLENGQAPSQSNANSPPTGQLRDLALERNLERCRKILRDCLPHQDVSQRLLNLFFDYQNSIFYICSINEAQSQVTLMYKDPERVNLSWYCQIFLIFSVAAQFDDQDDADEVLYHEIGKKYMDEAVEENPQDTLWVIRAMLLLCFYQPPTKLTSIWMYLDAAIRGAQRFQLDVGCNQQKELSDEAYQEWRQLWLTTISFDRWVAIFLGRLPRIKESISRDPVFKGSFVDPTLEHCVMQNHVTRLAIISGNVLRDLYFSKEFGLSECRKYKNELEKWTANLPNLMRPFVESGVMSKLSNDQAEAALNLYFMLLGAWMLLTRPLLVKAIKSTVSPIGFGGSIVSAVASDAGACMNYAFKLINGATNMLLVPLPPKRLFMPIFFLINAANIIVLGAVWKRKLNAKENSRQAYDQSRELAAIDAATKVLDFCGQRAAFARKYSILVKDLRQQLSNSQTTSGNDGVSRFSSTSHTDYQNSKLYDRSMAWSLGLSPLSDSAEESSPIYNQKGSDAQYTSSPSTTPMANVDSNQGYFTSLHSFNQNVEPWFEQSTMFSLIDDSLPYDRNQLIHDSEELDLLKDTMQ